MKKWKKKEQKDSEDFEGKLIRGSGNQWSRPGDSKSDRFLIESKQTEKKSYSISLKTWQKISDEALFNFRLPLLSLQIKDIELVVLSKQDFLKLLKG